MCLRCWGQKASLSSNFSPSTNAHWEHLHLCLDVFWWEGQYEYILPITILHFEKERNLSLIAHSFIRTIFSLPYLLLGECWCGKFSHSKGGRKKSKEKVNGIKAMRKLTKSIEWVNKQGCDDDVGGKYNARKKNDGNRYTLRHTR